MVNSPVDTPHGATCENCVIVPRAGQGAVRQVSAETPISTLSVAGFAPSLRNTTFAVTLPSAADGNAFT